MTAFSEADRRQILESLTQETQLFINVSFSIQSYSSKKGEEKLTNYLVKYILHKEIMHDNIYIYIYLSQLLV